MDTSTHVMGLLFAVGALVSWSGLSFFVRLATKDAPLLKTVAATTTINALFMGLASITFLPMAAFQPTLTRTYVLLIVVGLFMISLSRLTYYYAVQKIGPSRTIPIAASTPAVTALLATLTLGEPLTIRIMLGLILLIGGITSVVRSTPPKGYDQSEKSRRDIYWGYVAAGATTLNWSVSGVMLKGVALDMDPSATAALVIWIGMAFSWVLALAFGPKGEAGRIPRGNWKWMACAAVFQTVAIPSYSNALARTLAVNVTSITALQPLLVILGSHLFLRGVENITGKLVLGALLTVAGTILILV